MDWNVDTSPVPHNTEPGIEHTEFIESPNALEKNDVLLFTSSVHTTCMYK